MTARVRRAAIAAAGVALVVASGWLAEVRLAPLVDPAAHARVYDFLAGLFPVELSPAFLAVVGGAALRTLVIALTGTLGALVIAVPLGVLATGTLFRRGALVEGEPRGPTHTTLAALNLTARWLLGALRAVPDLVWAMLFVVGFGLGPLPGILALAMSYGGMLGRVLADLFEDVDERPLIALRATGASRLAIFAFGIWPQAQPGAIAYTLYSFECCVRAAAVAGLVGAGGIGYEIALSMRELAYGEVVTLVGALIAIMWLTELASAGLRRATRANAPPGLLAHRLRAESPLASLRGPMLAVAAAAVLASVVVAMWWSRDAVDAGSAHRMLRFVAGGVPPDLSVAHLRMLVTPVAQTLASSVIGTLIGAGLGGLLALAAMAPFAEDDRARGASRLPRAAIRWLARAVLLGLRAVPDVLWVLVFLIAVGIGPFAGTLALGVHTAGVLGRLYADALEEVPPLPLRGLRTTGASPLALLMWGAWPQARRTLISYTVLRWEMNLRASTVIGVAGGGGLGMALYNDVQLADYPRVATAVLLVGGLVAVAGALGDRIRNSR